MFLRFARNTEPMLDNEKYILKRISLNDENAFRELFRYYYPRAEVFLGKVISSREDVKDIAQNIFIRVWIMRAILPEINSFGAYLYRMCRNAAIDYVRSRGITVPIPDDFDIASGDTADQLADARETEMRMSRSVALLPEKRRKIFIMSRVEGLSNAEIAARLNISPKTVENQITLALRQLRTIVSAISLLLVNFFR